MEFDEFVAFLEDYIGKIFIRWEIKWNIITTWYGKLHILINGSYDLNGDGGVSAQELYEVQSDLQTEGEVWGTILQKWKKLYNVISYILLQILPAENYQTVINVVEIWMAGLPHYQGKADSQWDLQEFTAFLFGSIGEWGHS